MKKERVVKIINNDKGTFIKKEKVCSYPNLGYLMDEKNITISDLAKYLNYELYIVENLLSGWMFWNLRDMLKIKKVLNTNMTLDELFYCDWEIEI